MLEWMEPMTTTFILLADDNDGLADAGAVHGRLCRPDLTSYADDNSLYGTPVPTTPGWIAKLLAILSVTFFWVLPWSAMIAIAALLGTNDSIGWPRKMAVAGAILSTALTIAMTILLLWEVIRVGLI